MRKSQARLFAQYSQHDAEAKWLGRWPADIKTQHPAIDIARQEADLNDIGRLRYELYIERDGKRYASVERGARKFLEPIDRVSLNFHARHSGRLMSTVRLVRAEDAILDPHLGLLVEAYRPRDITRTVVNSRLAVLPEHRARALIIPLFKEVYRCGLLVGAKECLIGTRDELVPIFERFGFARTDTVVVDPVAKHMNVLCLQVDDIDHLTRINSPLLLVARSVLLSQNQNMEKVYA